MRRPKISDLNENSTKRTYFKPRYIVELSKSKKSNYGSKAKNLLFLENHRFRIPLTHVIGFQAFEDYQRDRNKTILKIEEELDKIISKNKKYALRSSTNLEDSSEHSYAGQFLTVLNAKNKTEIIKAIIEIWESSSDQKIIKYKDELKNEKTPLNISIIIQEMVESKYSGVVFTKNPVTGFDEIIIESVEGLGTYLVQDGVTPERWVRKWGVWKEKPEFPFTNENIISDLALESKKILKKYGKPIDLEWAYDGNTLYWLQLREITTLKNIKLYSNRMAREMIPGIILPLVWSINIPIVAGSWKLILTDLFGDSINNLDIMNLAKQFYSRAYFNMGLFGELFSILGMPRESLELMLGLDITGNEKPRFSPSLKTLKYVPRIIAFSFGITLLPYKINSYITDQKRFLYKMEKINIKNLTYSESIDLIDDIIEFGVNSSYIVVISQLMHSMFQMMSKKNKMHGINNYDSNFRLNELYIIYTMLSTEERKLLEDIHIPSTYNESSSLKNFIKNYKLFLKDFGHYSEHSNDMSYLTWKENPKQIIDLVKNYTIISNSNFKKKNDKSIAEIYRQYRDNVTYLYTKNYSYLRPNFLELSKKFLIGNILDDVNDIFYLSYDEIKRIIRDNKNDNYKFIVEERKNEIKKVKNIDPPELIFSEIQPELVVVSKNHTTLKGLAVSNGKCYGIARIIKSIADINKVCKGDIIIIPYSDVSWASLFNNVKGIVSESGGMLSHCAIIARELKLPAVVAVRGAMSIKDGSTVLVDGDLGEVKIE